MVTFPLLGQSAYLDVVRPRAVAAWRQTPPGLFASRLQPVRVPKLAAKTPGPESGCQCHQRTWQMAPHPRLRCSGRSSMVAKTLTTDRPDCCERHAGACGPCRRGGGPCRRAAAFSLEPAATRPCAAPEAHQSGRRGSLVGPGKSLAGCRCLSSAGAAPQPCALLCICVRCGLTGRARQEAVPAAGGRGS